MVTRHGRASNDRLRSRDRDLGARS